MPVAVLSNARAARLGRLGGRRKPALGTRHGPLHRRRRADVGCRDRRDEHRRPDPDGAAADRELGLLDRGRSGRHSAVLEPRALLDVRPLLSVPDSLDRRADRLAARAPRRRNRGDPPRLRPRPGKQRQDDLERAARRAFRRGIGGRIWPALLRDPRPRSRRRRPDRHRHDAEPADSRRDGRGRTGW